VATPFVARSGMPATSEHLLPPRYTDVRPIDRGGMGDIFQAHDQELGRDVAVKLLSARYATDESLRARFRREALAAARLSSNPNIVTIFDVAEHEGRPLIVMELMAGGSLEERLSRGRPCDPGQALAWLEQAAGALDAAHEAGVVHRDVKPGNLLLDDRGQIKVADFGIASATGMDSFTQTGTILGTAGYLSPEQARGARATAASDRYALAVVAWELLTGQRPFESNVPTAEAAAHVNAPVPSLHAANPALPLGYDAVFARALAKAPGDRYESAAEFVEDLRHVLHADAGETAWAGSALVAATPRRRLWPVLLAALALALSGGVVAALLLSRGSPDASPPRTVVHTVTSRGETVRETVTVSRSPAPSPASTPTSSTTSTTPATSPDGAALNDEGFRKLEQHDYAGALPLLEQAVATLSGSDSTVEAYADYNLALARRALGQCTDVTALLDRSEAIQGHRVEIDRLRKDARKACR
jgi:eukaryotic-like serine/threonine-protein kinase